MNEFTIVHDQVKEQRVTEDSKFYRNKALARIDGLLNGEPVIFWLYNSLDIQNIKQMIGGVAIITGVKNYFKQKGTHKAVSKNSQVGIILQTATENTINYTTKNKEYHLEIISSTNYNPYAYDNDAKDIQLKYSESNKEYRFHRLKDFIEAIVSKSILGDHRLIKDFVRIPNQLRYQSQLDPHQSLIKVSNVFNKKVLIIEGGPGTGKTTSLIHRLKFLTDPVVLKEKFNKENLDLKWIFLSPSSNLCRFLENSMRLENLEVNKNTVLIWQNKCLEIAAKFDILISNENSGYFNFQETNKSLFYNNENTLMIPNEIGKLLDNFILQDFQKRIKTISDTNDYSSSLKIEILKYLNNVKIDSITSLIQVLNNLNKSYKKRIENETSDLAKILDKETQVLFDKIKENTDVLDIINSFKKDIRSSENTINNDDDDLNLDEKSQDFISKFLKNLLIAKYRNSISNNKSYKVVYGKIGELININSDTKSKILLRGQFTGISKGPIRILVNGLSKYYDNFRKNNPYFKEKIRSEYWDILKSPKERLIFQEELNLLLGYKIKLIKSIKKLVSIYDNSIEKDLLDTLDDITYNVIGVDECTDYSIFDYYAINSLLKDNDFSSLTLCGDLMQRMTKSGINRWQDLKHVLGDNLEVKTLTQSYRQSASLINVAKKVYLTSLGNELHLNPKFERFDDEPLPIVYTNPNIDERIKWVHDRINEIRITYQEEFPSVAIFVPKSEGINIFIEKITSLPSIENLSIKNGESIDNNLINIIRVYDITMIKGLEFHAAFIFDLDELHDTMGEDVVNTTIYVALSRAAFYLGVTSSQPLDFLNKFGFQEGHW